MIEFNLLPDVKLDYIKATRTKRLVISVSVLVAGCALVILVLLFTSIVIFQKKHSKDLSKDIHTNVQQLQSNDNLDKILTVQNQLNSLTCPKNVTGDPCLHNKKPAVSRISDDLQKLIPSNITVSSLKVDFNANQMSIIGNTDTLNAVNIFVDTLKFTTYPTLDNDGKKIPLLDSNGKPVLDNANQPKYQEKPAFSSIVLTGFSVTQDSANGKKATYTITLNFDPAIFDNTKDIALTIPSQTTTRSQLEKPDPLFFQAPKAAN